MYYFPSSAENKFIGKKNKNKKRHKFGFIFPIFAAKFYLEIMMDSNYYCVIMAGGVGARFWPMSRRKTPKQFIDIMGDGQTLIQKTFQRFVKICPKENIYVVTNSDYVELLKSQIPNISDQQILLEPARRNTAPCIAYANYRIKEINPNAIIVVAPSDHIIYREDVFTSVINIGMKTVEKNPCLLTIGIRPSHPNTGYGYIQYNEDKVYSENSSIYAVKTFTEKPKLEMAQKFIESGDFLWNAGIFMWSLKSIQTAFEKYLPEIDQLFKQGQGFYSTPFEEKVIKDIYAVCKNISIDFGIMEKAQNVWVFAADFGWSDLGTWRSLYDIRSKDEHGNSIIGKRVKTYQTKNCLINIPKNKIVVVQGLEDYMIVENEGVLLIAKLEDEQFIRQYVTDVQVDFGEKYI
jgi:mannose-1-phosphate guanylyltransferase